MWEIILNILIAIGSITLAGIAFYLDTKKKIQEQVNGEIDAAEDTDKKDKEKMAYVVDNIYNNLVPRILRPILNKKAIEKIVQAAFDKIEDYARKQIAKKSN